MKDNTQKAKQLLQQAIREMPQDFALSEARYHLGAALSKIQEIEKKRERRHIQELQQQQQQLQVGQSTNIRETLNCIDEMINAEKRKIEEINERRKQRQQPQDDDDEPLLG